MVNVSAAQQAGGFVAVVHPELAAGAVAIGVDGGLRHPELAGDLLGAEMLVHEAQAFSFALGQQLDGMGQIVGPNGHALHSKRRISQNVYFDAKVLSSPVRRIPIYGPA
jgi:hypothetical protein